MLLASTMLAAPLQAQEAPPPTEGARANQGDEIVVTARRREENIQSVPISITAIGQETLENLRVQDASNLTALEPSFSVSASSGRPNSPVYSIRGIRPTEAIYGQDPTVAVYLAEVVQSPSQGSNLGFYDLENIQILKGPQGTLFGRNTVGGAILLTPRKPGDEFSVSGMIGAGNYGLFETELGIDIPLADTFKVRLSGRTIDGGDYQTYVNSGALTGQKLGGQTLRSFRGTIVAEMTPDITNTIMVTYDDKDTPSRGATLVAVNPNHPRATQSPALFGLLAPALQRAQNRSIDEIESDMEMYDDVWAWSVTDTFEAKLNPDLTFKFIGNYREVGTRTKFDLDASNAPGILSTDQEATLQHHSLEAQLQGTSFGGSLDWVLGGYYYNEKGEEYSPGGFFGSYIYQTGIVDNSSYSVFGQGSFKLTPDLTLTAGARMNWDKRSMVIGNNFNGVACLLRVPNEATPDPNDTVGLPISDCFVPLSGSFSQPTATVSLDYKVTPDVLLYATSRLGYRSGGFNLRATQPIQYEPFEPETVLDFEGGVKADWWAGGVGMRTNIAVFYQKYDDIQRTVQVQTPAGSPASVVTNAAAANVFGIEVQQQIRPSDWFMLQFNYAYNDPAYEEWIDPATGDDLSDTPFFFTPTHSGSVLATITAPLDDDMEAYLTGNAAYVGEHWINALHTSVIIDQHPDSIRPLLKQEAYWLVDLSAGVRNIGGREIDVNLYVKNLTDERYKVGGIQLYTGASGFIAAAYSPPRTYGAQVRFRF